MKKRYIPFLIPVFLFLSILFCFNFLSLSCSAETSETPFYSYKIIHVYPHDPEAFTQGLVFENGFFYEGTGLYQFSSLRRVDLNTGKVLQLRKIPDRFFGEGITVFKNKIIQLTWREETGLVYDKKTFQQLGKFQYSHEGWGITHDGKYLIVSDGSSALRFLKPDDYSEVREIKVQENDIPIFNINELEYVKGEIFANIWKTDLIARINPQTGSINGWIDLKGILGDVELYKNVDVLNGIAYDDINDRLFVTGKFWPNVFEIELARICPKNN